MGKVRKIVSRIISPHTYSDEAYVNYLRSKGAKIGENTRFIYPRKCHVDTHRAEYIIIGNNCCLSQVSILAHDYSWYVALEAKNELIPDPGGYVIIGNNCFVGYEALILKDSIIGDNVIIGARSIITGTRIPSNTVWAGAPAKMICTLEDFINKKKQKAIDDIYFRKKILDSREKYSMEDFGWFMFFFLPRTEENYQRYINGLEFNGVKAHPAIKEHFFATEPIWQDYEAFIYESEMSK